MSARIGGPAAWARTWRHAVDVLASDADETQRRYAATQKRMAERRYPDIAERCTACGRVHGTGTPLGPTCARKAAA